jgi:hypothetical protein
MTATTTMTTPLISLAQIETATDVRIEDAGFSATEVTISALTEAGKSFISEMFGTAVVSVKMPKSKAIDFARFCQQRGIVAA